jgi:hypothetical protein
MSSSQTAASNVFIDLATFSELEGFLYGGPNAITLFVASVQKANWFSYIPISLRHVTGVPDFGQKNIAASVNRSGDYVLSVWFNTQIPQIGIKQTATMFIDATVRWTRNLMHNIFEKCSITFNELYVEEFDSYYLDNLFQFKTRGSKRVGYRNMIGDISSMTTPVPIGGVLGTGGYFSCPLPFWFTEDSGIALPAAALPFNDIKINYHFRKFEDLIVVFPGMVPPPNQVGSQCTVSDIYVVQNGQVTSASPKFQNPNTFAHYAVVHNDERVKMGDAPRDMLISQIQDQTNGHFKDISSTSTFDLRFSHAVVSFFFNAQNTSIYEQGKGKYGAEWSNYTTEPAYAGLDPFDFSQLIYENTVRLANRADYFSLVQPWYMSKAIPTEVGYHMWSYALHPWCPTSPSASTNYSKLANVSIQHDMSPAAQQAAGLSGAPVDQYGAPITYPNAAGVLVAMPLKLRHIFIVRNWNIARVANGSLGQPTL